MLLSCACATKVKTSLPVRGAWVEIRDAPWRVSAGSASLPVRGAWVEITQKARGFAGQTLSLPVRGAWVEIASLMNGASECGRRSPCGERGLKWLPWLSTGCGQSRSLPVRGAWVEIAKQSITSSRARVGRSPCGERGLKCASSA